MTDCTERHQAAPRRGLAGEGAPRRGLAGEGQKGMTKVAQS